MHAALEQSIPSCREGPDQAFSQEGAEQGSGTQIWRPERDEAEE